MDVPKLWVYFKSNKLSDRDDDLYSLEQSYVSKMNLVVNGYKKEIIFMTRFDKFSGAFDVFAFYDFVENEF